jgi:hypothetical protein
VKKSLTQAPKLKLTRETLRSLHNSRLPEAVGGDLTPTCTVGPPNNTKGHPSVTVAGCN